MSPSAIPLARFGPAPLPVTILLLLLASFYTRAWVRFSRKNPGQVSSWRLASFLAGLTLLWLAWSVSLSALTHLLLIAHMVQHLLFMLFGPPLILLGEPFLVFAPSRPSGSRLPKQKWARAAVRWLTHPVPAGLLMVAVAIAWHTPVFFARAMASPIWHEIENLTFLGSGFLFWCPVILPWPTRQQWPRWTIPIYLLGSDMPVSVLTAYLAFCGHVVYPAYLSAPRPFAISALDDQVAAAMLMWVAMLIVFLAVAAIVVIRLLEPRYASATNPQTALPVSREPSRSSPGRNTVSS